MKKIEGNASDPSPYQQNSIDVQPVLPQTNQLRKEKKTGNMPIKSSKKD